MGGRSVAIPIGFMTISPSSMSMLIAYFSRAPGIVDDDTSSTDWKLIP